MTPRRRLLIPLVLALLFGPSLFLTWQTYRMADRAARVEGRYTGMAAASCEPRPGALVATWSEVAVRQIWRETGGYCREVDRWDGNVGAGRSLSGNLERDFTLPCDDEEPLDFATRYQVSTQWFQEACDLRSIALRTFRVTAMLSVVGAVIAVRLMRRPPQAVA